ncbi:hypothetical protein BC826DRAFT_1040669, partial [Russula brevipes]
DRTLRHTSEGKMHPGAMHGRPPNPPGLSRQVDLDGDEGAHSDSWPQPGTNIEGQDVYLRASVQQAGCYPTDRRSRTAPSKSVWYAQFGAAWAAHYWTPGIATERDRDTRTGPAPKNTAEFAVMRDVLHREVVGALSWVALTTRPDTTFAATA